MQGLTAIAGIRVGHASNFDALTGCTAILCEGGAVGGVDVRGSASETSSLDTLQPGHIAGQVHAASPAAAAASGVAALAETKTIPGELIAKAATKVASGGKTDDAKALGPAVAASAASFR